MKTQLKTYAAAAKLLQLCPTLCDPIDSSTPGSPVPGIIQARTLDWVCHFLLQCMKVKSESEVAQSCPTLRNLMHGLQPTRLLCPWDFPGKSTSVFVPAKSRGIPSPGDLSDTRIEPVSLALAGKFFITEPSGKPIGAGIFTAISLNKRMEYISLSL